MTSARRHRIPEIILGTIFILVLIGLLLPTLDHGNSSKSTVARNNLKRIALAMHNYLATNGAFPAQAIRGKNGKPLLSWRVALLPYFEPGTVEAQLYGQFHLDEPWNSAHNLRLLDQMPEVYRNPSAPETGRTIYLSVVGDKTVFGGAAGATPAEMTDGLSNTIMLVEADYSVPWTKPEDLDYDAAIPLNGLGHAHPSGFNALLSDGSAKFLLDTINLDTLRGLMTINGGEDVTVP